jgi:prepilin-type N-terminal cleavage/methylation domain-containing protein
MAARKKSGFTLIELLVVIAIIAILAAILFPVFARAREAARKSTCQSNMKECAIALQTYWNDYDATLPCSVPASTQSTTSSDPFLYFSSRLGVVPPGIATDPCGCPVTWSQMLYNSMKSKDIMFCPSDSADRTPPAGDAGYKDAKYTVSYWWKYAVDLAWNDPALKCQKEGDFGYNADQVIFYEHAGFHSGSAGGLKNDVQINVAYLDTHVKSISLVNSSQVATSTTLATSCRAGGEPNYFNFDNNIAKKQAANGDDASANPKGANIAATYIDPRTYSDMLP